MSDTHTKNNENYEYCTVTFTDMNCDTIVSRLIRLLSREIRKHHLDYGSVRYIYREVKKRCHLTTPRKPKRLVKLYTQEEIDRFFSVIENPVHKLIMELAIGSGLRVSELVSIEAKNINFTNNTIQIIGKGNKERLVLISNRLKEKIQLYLSNRTNRYLFESSRHSKFGTRRIQALFTEYKNLAKIEKNGNIHQFRHQYFSKLCDAGISREHRALLAGHESTLTQDIYSHASLGSVSRDILEKLEVLGL